MPRPGAGVSNRGGKYRTTAGIDVFPQIFSSLVHKDGRVGRTKIRRARHKSAAPLGAQGPAATRTPVWGLHAAAVAILLVLLVVATFSPCLQNDFLISWDDDENFLENHSYRGLGWEQIRW